MWKADCLTVTTVAIVAIVKFVIGNKVNRKFMENYQKVTFFVKEKLITHFQINL